MREERGSRERWRERWREVEKVRSFKFLAAFPPTTKKKTKKRGKGKPLAVVATDDSLVTPRIIHNN